MANRLLHEQSPYLQQHAHNPVDWHPWGDEAFAEAARRNVPVLVSIGYAACHWCHVMERESFEDPGTAAFMNQHFVCVKVDREEHPDVDHMYMDAVQAISGSGGWPLNVFVTPEREPFFGGTYYPPQPAYSRPSWRQLLQRMSEVWRNQPDEVAAQASQMIEHLKQASRRMTNPQTDAPTVETCRKMADNLLTQADKEAGGFGNAPKFPGTMAISYLLQHYSYTGYQPALQHALRSLDAMIDGGIYDQIGGGLARYATDRHWLIPHFEKMLYDNALLISVLCEAWLQTRTDRYKTIAEDIIAFVNRELRHPTGGFYCALDADSEGVEGKYYTWTWEEWTAASVDPTGHVARYWGVTPGGNWEHTNILHIPQPAALVAGELGISEQELMEEVAIASNRLLAMRQQRIRPLTDDKCLLAWNAMMNKALCDAAMAFGNNDYLTQAAAHMQWMEDAYTCATGLLHTCKDGVARIPAKLDDYACLIQAQLQLASATGDGAYINKAAALIGEVTDKFSQDDVFFYYTPVGQADIPVRKVDLYDGATPSPNSIMARNLLLAGMATERNGWIMRAERMLQNMSATVLRYPTSFALWAQQMQQMVVGPLTVVVTGSDAVVAAHALHSKYIPHAWVLACEKEICEPAIFEKKYFNGKLAIFVCSKSACLPPVNSVEHVEKLIAQQKER